MMGEVYSTAAQVWVWLGTERLKPLKEGAITTLNWYRELSQAATELDPEMRKTKVLDVALKVESKGVYYPLASLGVVRVHPRAGYL